MQHQPPPKQLHPKASRGSAPRLDVAESQGVAAYAEGPPLLGHRFCQAHHPRLGRRVVGLPHAAVNACGAAGVRGVGTWQALRGRGQVPQPARSMYRSAPAPGWSPPGPPETEDTLRMQRGRGRPAAAISAFAAARMWGAAACRRKGGRQGSCVTGEQRRPQARSSQAAAQPENRRHLDQAEGPRAVHCQHRAPLLVAHLVQHAVPGEACGAARRLAGRAGRGPGGRAVGHGTQPLQDLQPAIPQPAAKGFPRVRWSAPPAVTYCPSPAAVWANRLAPNQRQRRTGSDSGLQWIRHAKGAQPLTLAVPICNPAAHLHCSQGCARRRTPAPLPPPGAAERRGR